MGLCYGMIDVMILLEPRNCKKRRNQENGVNKHGMQKRETGEILSCGFYQDTHHIRRGGSNQVIDSVTYLCQQNKSTTKLSVS